MLSMIGFLFFCCKVVVPGRAFLRRLIDKTKGVKELHHRIKLNKECKLDMQAWHYFVKTFNGRSFFLDEHWNDSHTLQLFTDSSKSLGFGAVFGINWFYGEWPDKWKTYNIVVLELFPIVLSIDVWGSQLRNKQIYINTDNEALVYILNKQSSPDRLTMILIRRLVLLLLKFNIHLRAKHIAGVKNVLADALSRLQVAKFKKLASSQSQHHFHSFNHRSTRTSRHETPR